MKKSNNSRFQTKKRATPLHQLIGTVRRQADGFGFVIPEDPTLPDVYLPRHQMRGVINQDKVEVAVFPLPYRKNKFSGKVLKILSQRSHLVVGQCFPLSDKIGLIRDDSAQWGADLKIDLKRNQKIKKGEWVQAKVLHWPDSDEGFRGEYVCSLGVFPHATEDNMRVIQKQGIPAVFSKECLKEAKNLYPKGPSPVTGVENIKHKGPIKAQKSPKNNRMFSSFLFRRSKVSRQREDLRHLPFVTIDGQTAQDFDDAIYVQAHSKGWTLYVAIADVSHYVRAGSALDKSAKERGNSTYFPGWTVPMLPEQISNDLCSLKPYVPRLVFVAEMHFNSKFQREFSRFYEGIIQSQGRLTYGEAQDIIELTEKHVPRVKDSLKEKNKSKKAGPYSKESEEYSPEVVNNVVSAGQLAQNLLAERQKKHFINLEIPETEVHLNAMGEPVDITQSPRLFAHQLIEELMLSANQAVAEYLHKNKIPSLYRVHDLPKADSLKVLEKMVQSLGFKTELRGKEAQKNISSLISHFDNHPLSEVLQILVLRSLSQALYSAHSKGHFGLNLKHYTHFTSPIRRYSDLIVHRVLKASLFKERGPYKQKDLESLSSLISACEQRSVKAERYVQDIKKVRFMRKHLGQEMEGRIAGLTRFGFFVRLRLYDVEGLVSINKLRGQWEFEESLLELRSATSHRRFKMGDLVLVQVVSANIESAQIDFDLKEHRGKKFISKKEVPLRRKKAKTGMPIKKGRKKSRKKGRKKSKKAPGRRKLKKRFFGHKRKKRA